MKPAWERFASGKLDADTLAGAICLQTTGDPNHAFRYGLSSQLETQRERYDLRSSLNYILRTHNEQEQSWTSTLRSSPQGLFALDKVPQHRLEGYHRSGWAAVVDALATLHRSDAPLLDCFLDRTFGWDSKYYEGVGLDPLRPALVRLPPPPRQGRLQRQRRRALAGLPAAPTVSRALPGLVRLRRQPGEVAAGDG